MGSSRKENLFLRAPSLNCFYIICFLFIIVYYMPTSLHPTAPLFLKLFSFAIQPYSLQTIVNYPLLIRIREEKPPVRIPKKTRPKIIADKSIVTDAHINQHATFQSIFINTRRYCFDNGTRTTDILVNAAYFARKLNYARNELDDNKLEPQKVAFVSQGDEYVEIIKTLQKARRHDRQMFISSHQISKTYDCGVCSADFIVFVYRDGLHEAFVQSYLKQLQSPHITLNLNHFAKHLEWIEFALNLYPIGMNITLERRRLDKTLVDKNVNFPDFCIWPKSTLSEADCKSADTFQGNSCA